MGKWLSFYSDKIYNKITFFIDYVKSFNNSVDDEDLYIEYPPPTSNHT